MKGWTDDEFKNKELMAPCGLYCGTCSIYIATRDNNEKLKTAERWNICRNNVPPSPRRCCLKYRRSELKEW